MTENNKSVFQWTTWEQQKTEKKNALKQRLLLGSLELVKGDTDNEDACREVVEQALEARMYSVAFEALHAFSNEAAFSMCISIGKLFEDIGNWTVIPKEVVAYCEDRALKSEKCTSTFGFGDHFCDQRSRALALIGRYYFFTGQRAEAMHVWNAAGDRQDVDEVLAEMCVLIAENSKKDLEAAMDLLDAMKTKAVKAKTMAKLSKYV